MVLAGGFARLTQQRRLSPLLLFLPPQMGHYWGLFHTFQGESCASNGASDGIDVRRSASKPVRI